MRGKKCIGLLFLLIAVVVGDSGLSLVQKALHRTPDTAFCLSCHPISKPFEEYQGAIHFSDQRGIHVECANCHIPRSGAGHLFTKLKASKGIYREFVSDKIDSDDKLEVHRQEMAETVWKELKTTDSATYRGCHSFGVMGIASQSESAQKMHNKAQKDSEICIDCHKGVAHFPSEIKVDDNAAHGLESQAATSITNGAHIYLFEASHIDGLATATPSTDLTVVDVSGKQPIVRLQGYRMQSSENTLYPAVGQRLAPVTLNGEGIETLMVNGE